MPSMEFFWGVEVKPGQTVSCDPEKGCILRVSQAALGERMKGSANIVVSAKVDDQKVIIGTLSAESRPQFLCDLIFHKQFELSHSSNIGSVFVCGYRAVMPDLPDYGSSKDEGEVKTVNNQVIKDDHDSSSLADLSSSDDDLTEDESSSQDDSSEGDGASSEEDDTSSEELDTSPEEIATSSEEDSSDEEGNNTPKKLDGNKRVTGTSLKTPCDKKAKVATPSEQITGEVKIVNNQVIKDASDSSLDLSSSDDELTEDESCRKDDSSEEDGASSGEDDTSSEELDTSPEEIATSSEEDSSDEEGKNTPKKLEDGKKRVAETALKTPSDKKAKVATPSDQITGDTKVPHVSIHPAKQASNVPGNSKSKAKSPKSVGTHACKSCSRTFGSDSALLSHEKAKHI